MVRKDDDNIIPDLNLPKVNSKFYLTQISDEDIIEAIYQIKSNAAGSDKLPLKFYKLLIPHIIKPLLNIINSSFELRTYPELFKKIIVNVNPIPKSNEPKVVNDYRPICCINVCAKIISYIINKRLSSYVENNKLLNRYQSGFSINIVVQQLF